MRTELSKIIKDYTSFEITVRQQITKICAPYCSVCEEVCCRPEFCRENLDSPFLGLATTKCLKNTSYRSWQGWLTSSGCALSTGRPPVCYQFNCNRITDNLPDDLRRYLFKVLSNLVPHIGRRSLGTRHLVEIMEPAQLNKVKSERFTGRLNEARRALKVIQSHNNSRADDVSSFATLSKIVPIPRSLAGNQFDNAPSQETTNCIKHNFTGSRSPCF
jgi:hypothetical protein